ncbi:MAG: nitroreductase family protein, partial [Streptosporangiaceae bacterium]
MPDRRRISGALARPGQFSVNDVLHAIRTRRVVRALTDAPVEHGQLQTILDSVRYAPHAGNRRLHRYVVV